MRIARSWLWVLVPIALVVGYILWTARPVPVDVTQARLGPAVEMVYASGYVDVEQPVAVASRVTAPVMRVLVREGDSVKQGQPLVVLDDAEQRGAIAQANAELTRASLDEARKRTLFREGWLARSGLEQAAATANVARAVASSAQARADQYVVRAGIDGIVLKRDVEPGDLSLPSKTLFLIGDPQHLRVTATVDERDVPRLRVGQSALMSSDAWPGRVIRGHLRELTPGGDPTQRAFRARLAIDDVTVLPLGLTLEVNIVTSRTERAVLVPPDTFLAGNIWVVSDGRAHRRAVRLGIAGADLTQIVAGVRAGEQVVRSPSAALREGDRVTARTGSAK
jgi:RND family efflux transporter MFP subunit